MSVMEITSEQVPGGIEGWDDNAPKVEGDSGLITGDGGTEI